MPEVTDVTQALRDGAHRSIMACSIPANDPLVVRAWRRYRWPLAGIVMFLLLELVGLGSLASGIIH